MEPAGRYDAIVFSIIDFDFRFQRPQQLATQFGRHGHRVFYLSTTRFLSPGGPAWDLVRKADRVGELKIRSRRSLNVYSGHLDAADVDVLAESFETLAADLAIGDAVCLVQIPFWAPLAYRLRERLGWKVVYDCMDEWTNFPGFGQSVLSLEEKLVRAADATIVSADRLEEKWKGTAPRLVLARNAMDAEHYRARFGPNALLVGRAAPDHRLLRRARLVGGRPAPDEDRGPVPERHRSSSPAAVSTWTWLRSRSVPTCACSASGRTTKCRSSSGTSTLA